MTDPEDRAALVDIDIASVGGRTLADSIISVFLMQEEPKATVISESAKEVLRQICEIVQESAVEKAEIIQDETVTELGRLCEEFVEPAEAVEKASMFTTPDGDYKWSLGQKNGHPVIIMTSVEMNESESDNIAE